MSRHAAPCDSGMSGRSTPLTGGGSGSKFRGSKATNSYAAPATDVDLDEFRVDDDDVDTPVAVQAPAAAEPVVPPVAAQEPEAAPPLPPAQPLASAPKAKATRASTRASAKAAPSAAAAAHGDPSATLISAPASTLRGSAAAARGSARSKGGASAAPVHVPAPPVTQAAPVTAPVHVQDAPMEEDVATEVPPPPRDEAPPSAAMQRGDLHPRTAADTEQQQQQQQQQQDIEEEDAVMEEATLPMGAHAGEPAYMLCDAAPQPAVAPVHAPALAAAVAPLLDAAAAAMAQMAPPPRAPVRAVTLSRPSSSGAMPPPAASPRRVDSGAAVSALPRDTAERHISGGVHEQAAAATMRAPPAPAAQAPASPAVTAAPSPRAVAQAPLPSQGANDMQLAVASYATQLAPTAGVPQQQYDSGAIGEALNTSMQVLQSLDQAQAVAARLYDEVRRQQVRTQMVINDALMLCSPAFGSVAANIKAALAGEMRKLDEMPQAMAEQENQQHGGGGALP